MRRTDGVFQDKVTEMLHAPDDGSIGRKSCDLESHQAVNVVINIMGVKSAQVIQVGPQVLESG